MMIPKTKKMYVNSIVVDVTGTENICEKRYSINPHDNRKE